MSKVTVEFDLGDLDEKLAFKRAISADNAYLVLHAISNKLFRPARKNGYDEGNHLQKCIDKATNDGCNIGDFELKDHTDDVVTSAISSLESKFYELLEEYDINMEDLP